MDDLAQDADKRYGFGLTEPEVRRLQDILRREGEAEVTLDQAWTRAIELLSLFRMLLGPLPEDQSERYA
jgi:hypothetical protein